MSNLRVLCRLYVWAKQTGGFDLDDFLEVFDNAKPVIECTGIGR